MEEKVSLEKILQILLRTVISLAILGGAVGLLIALGTPDTSKRQKGRLSETPTVETVRAEPHLEGIDFTVDGVVIPFREVVVSPEVSGRVLYKSPNCRQGRFVERGECLFRIDPANYKLDVQRLDAALEQAKASVSECDVEIRNLTEQVALSKEQVVIQERELERYESVDDPGVYSQSEIDMARNTVLSAKNALQQLESQGRLKEASKKRLETICQSAEVQRDRAKLDLKRTEVVAPLSGVVTSYNVEQDSYLQAGASAVTIQDTSRLQIRCSLYMQQIGWLWQTEYAKAKSELPAPADSASPLSQTASFKAYRLPDVPVTVRYQLDNACWEWKGMLTSYDGSSVDANTRMMPCRVTVNNPLDAEAALKCDETISSSILQKAPPTLMAGMFVEVEIHSKPDIPLLKIEEAALIPGNQVWTVNDGVLKRHQVRVAQIEDGKVVIYAEDSKIKVGDRVVVSPLATPTDGMKVNLAKSSPSKTSPSPKPAPVVLGGSEAKNRL
ncbi:MAG: HlyD family efflux transporter periplasmic adaptor subunit [Planctomycetia bacterium]|jgi:multidrug efflux pump subunit AcrA (membrane-fusion protein)